MMMWLLSDLTFLFFSSEKGNVIVMTFTILVRADLDLQSGNFLTQPTDINLQGCDNVSLTDGVANLFFFFILM